MHASCDSSADLDERLIGRHKILFTKVVMPSIVTMAVMLVAFSWRFDPKFYSGLLLMVALNCLNVYYSIENRVVNTPWGAVQSRSDEFDTFRWCASLPLDV